MKDVLKKLAYGLSAVGLAGAMSACTDFLDNSENNYTSPALVSFYHASPDAPQLTITVEEKNFLNAPLAYSQYAGYKNFYVGNRVFKFRNAANTTLLDTTLALNPNNSYSVFIINNNESIETLVTTDTADAPGAGKAMVRFLQLSPDTNPIDVAIVGDAENTFSNQAYKTGTPFKEITARTFKLILKNSDTDEEILTSTNISLLAGHYYTIISRGFGNPPEGKTNTLSVQVVENE
jgi:Domain of unknown function (DUF4397)